MNFILITASFVASLVLTLGVRKYLLRRKLLDMPNERSSHLLPVPRGGGWALMLVLVPGMIIGGIVWYNLVAHIGLLIGVVSLIFISWLDDKKGASARSRLSVHLLAASFGSLCFPAEALLFNGALPFVVDRAIMILGWAWFINLYNFMDGIDGITGTETVSIAVGTCLVMTAIGVNDPFLSILTLLLIGSCLGFLALNWHPAKIFLGDVGSVPLGYLTGFCLLSLALHGHLIAALILPLYYLADSGITLAKRALRREKIWEAHRQHFYQRAALGMGRHDHVVYGIAAADVGLIIAALLSVYRPLMGVTAATLVVALLLWNMHKLAHAAHNPPR